LEGVRVAVLVAVGVAEIRGVAVGEDVGVLVGMVSVGKGPRSASAVPAIAVLVMSEFLCDCSCRLNTLPLLKKSA